MYDLEAYAEILLAFCSLAIDISRLAFPTHGGALISQVGAQPKFRVYCVTSIISSTIHGLVV
jgi:hypothetical protein